jgi:hypothetical protein
MVVPASSIFPHPSGYLPFARELWTADAAVPLREVRVPVLIIIGKKDLQVDRLAMTSGGGLDSPKVAMGFLSSSTVPGT